MTDYLREMALAFNTTEGYPEIATLNKEGKKTRTEEFMELGGCLKTLQNEIDDLLKIISDGKGFEDLEKSKYIGTTAERLRNQINNWSCEKLFERLRDKATRIVSNYNADKGELPNPEASAWLAYFASFDKSIQYGSKWVPNQNWIDYYYENYPCSKERK